MESYAHLWPEVYNLSADEDGCRVWCLTLDLPSARLHRLSRLLSEEERCRAQSFQRRLDQCRFVARRGLLRETLSRSAGEPPEALRFVYGRYGKPALAGASSALHFNLSHSGSLALLAAGPREVGIDLQRVETCSDWERLARRFFSAREQASLAALPCRLQRPAFFQAWCRHEAVSKARGDGLAGLAAAAEFTEPLFPWSLVGLDLERGGWNYAACLAIRRKDSLL